MALIAFHHYITYDHCTTQHLHETHCKMKSVKTVMWLEFTFLINITLWAK
jgi:hypothetical protein